MLSFCQEAFVAISSPQIDRLVHFYSQLFSQAPDPYRQSSYAEFSLPKLRLAIFQPHADYAGEFIPQTKGSVSICLQVSDLPAVVEQLEIISHPPSSPVIATSHGWELYIYDPDGNRVIVYQKKSP
jgi:predicted enzyme related to lactoylglutathione lyase